jgi:hypothetical protein
MAQQQLQQHPRRLLPALQPQRRRRLAAVH